MSKNVREKTTKDKDFFLLGTFSFESIFSVSCLVLCYQYLIFLCAKETINLFPDHEKKKTAFVREDNVIRFYFSCGVVLLVLEYSSNL